MKTRKQPSRSRRRKRDRLRQKTVKLWEGKRPNAEFVGFIKEIMRDLVHAQLPELLSTSRPPWAGNELAEAINKEIPAILKPWRPQVDPSRP